MEGTVADFSLPIVAQSIADALDDGTYYQVEEMMTLYISIGIALVYTQIIEVKSHFIQLIPKLLEAALQLEQLCPHLLSQIIYRPLRILDSDRRQHDDLIKLRHIKMHRHLAMTHIEQHVP